VLDGRELWLSSPHTSSDQSRVSGSSYHLEGERERGWSRAFLPTELVVIGWPVPRLTSLVRHG
jgi:hypothetical protein